MHYKSYDYVRVPGTKYCGSGNRMDLGKPLNALDEACWSHDWAYDKWHKRNRRYGRSPLTTFLKADDRLIRAAKKHGGVSGRAVAGLFGAKKRIYAHDPGDRSLPKLPGTEVQMGKSKRSRSSKSAPYRLGKRAKASKKSKLVRNNAMAASDPTSNLIGLFKIKARKGLFKKKKGFDYGRSATSVQAFHPHSVSPGQLPWMSLQVDQQNLKDRMDDEFIQQGIDHTSGLQVSETIDMDKSIDDGLGQGNAQFNIKTLYHLKARNNGFSWLDTGADPDVYITNQSTVIADCYYFECRAASDNDPLFYMNQYYSNLQAKALDTSEKADYRNSMLTAYKYYPDFRRHWKLLKSRRFKMKPGEEVQFQFGDNYTGNPYRLNLPAIEFIPQNKYFAMRLQGDIAHETGKTSVEISASALVNFENVALDIIGTRANMSGKKDGVWKQQNVYSADLTETQFNMGATTTVFANQ